MARETAPVERTDDAREAGARKLREQRQRWQEKAALRAVYVDAYRRMASLCRPGRTLEIGGGSGNFRAHGGAARSLVATDIVQLPWLDAVCDAHALPFASGAFANIVMFDVLHHLARPTRFFAEAARVLRAGGRLIVCEPAITPLSLPFYRFLHPEPVVLRTDPFADAPASSDDPFDSNQAVPTLLLGSRRARRRFERRVPTLEVTAVQHLSFLAYPLSGGFRRWSAIPGAWVPSVLAVEEALAPIVGRVAGFRLIAALERRPRGRS